jgi:NAD(P)-dependent dehydrogenase (short-subunit alcohol dehydrogenase family)
MSTEKKIALVTGAGTGIGKAVSLGLAEDGFAVVLTGRRSQHLDAVASLIKERGGQALAIAGDVSKEVDIKTLFAQVQSAFGRLDLLFNNAGTGAPPVPIEDLSLARWQAVVDVNLTGAFLCTREAVRIMKNQVPRGGRIINNGSISAHSPRPNSAPYTATKHAITGLTKSTALDGRAFDIACGQIDIGNANTIMGEHIAKGMPQPNGTIMGEALMQVEDVAKAVRYMAGLPLSANVLSMTVMASGMPFVGRG